MARSKKNRVLAVRNTVIAFMTIVVILILGFGTYVSTGGGTTNEAITESDYREVDTPRARKAGDPIEVAEYFSYACIHCKTFDPVMKSWAEEQSDDVTVKLVPVNFSPIWSLLAQTFLTLENTGALEQNHARIFRALHDAGRQFLTPEMVADYVDGRGITREEFLKTFNSPSIKRALQNAQRDQQMFGVTATPSIVVANKYVVDMTGGQARALQVVDYLIQKERDADKS